MIGELLLSSVILSTSFSVRTPNDDTKPLDYEYMIKAEETEGNFTWSVKRDWERELGEKYEDNVWKINQKSRILYGGIDYVNKESKDINYTTYNLGLKHLTGIQAKQAAIIIAKEEGAIQVRIMNEYELLGAMAKFEERMHKYNKFR